MTESRGAVPIALALAVLSACTPATTGGPGPRLAQDDVCIAFDDQAVAGYGWIAADGDPCWIDPDSGVPYELARDDSGWGNAMRLRPSSTTTVTVTRRSPTMHGTVTRPHRATRGTTPWRPYR